VEADADVTVLAEASIDGEEAAEQMDATAPPAASPPHTEVGAAEAGNQDPSSVMSGEPPDQSSSLDSGAAYRVLSEAAAELHPPRESPGQSVSGSHRSRGSDRSKGSKHSQEPLGYPSPPLEAAPQEPKPPPRGALRFDIRPGLVDMTALNKVMRDNASVRDRRVKLADQRRERYPIESQLSYMAQPQRMLHRHVHHHVHYHGNEDDEGVPGFKFSGATTSLPEPMTMAPGQLAPLQKLPSASSKGSKNSKRSGKGSRSTSDLKLKPLKPAGPPGPALRSKLARSATESSLDSAGVLQQRMALDADVTPRRRQEA